MKMKKYSVGIEVIRAYVIEVEAETPQAATQKAEDLSPDFIDANGEYVDTHTIAEDDPEESVGE